MAFKPGTPKPKGSGRKKGQVNKTSLLVREVLENHGINLVEQIMVRLPKLDVTDQVKAMVQMMPYVYPKLTTMEHRLDGNPYGNRELEGASDDELDAILEARFELLKE